MKKTRKRLTFAAAIAGTALAASLTACQEAQEPVETVYGPPNPMIGTYDPASEIPEDVYGPPSDEPEGETGTEEDAGAGSSHEEITSEPADPQETEKIPAALYGPPEDEPENYDPEENIEADVYGPPEGNW